MEVAKDEGYFHKYAKLFRRTITPKEFEQFASLSTDQERFAFVNELKWRVVNELPLEQSLDKGKCLELALEYKVNGDRLKQDEDWLEALKCYNQCYLLLPEENVLEKAHLLDNRSQVLMQLGKFDQSLEDADRAINYGFPVEQLSTIWERKARIFQSKKNFKAAVECFDKAIDCLTQRPSLTSEYKRDERIEELKKLTDAVYYQYKNVQRYLEPPKVSRPFQTYLDDSVQYDSTETEGRFATAKTTLRPNQTILKEKPHAATLLKEYSRTHCSSCFERIEVLYCCPDCTDVVFCSGRCEKNGCQSYHRYECGYLGSLWSSGATIVSLLALRVITQKPYSYFDELRQDLSGLTATVTDKLPDDDYRKIFNLVTHSDKRSTEDYLIWTLMATMLNSVLKMTNYNREQHNDNFLGYLLLHNLQIINYNAHDVSEVQRKHSNEMGVSVAVGAALYPMLALFNHSCDPGIVRYFAGTTVHVRTIKNIAAGTIIAENYGPLYTRMSRPERRQSLATNYMFECNCQACDADWPTCANMIHSVIRFRCTGTECQEVVPYNLHSDCQGVRCGACGHIVDIGERIRMLREANMIGRFNEASHLYQVGLLEHALAKYAAIMMIMDQVLVPPYRDYHMCQQGMRRCCLDLGSCYISCPSSEK